MTPSTAAKAARLPNMTVAQLRDYYHATFGEPTASRHKTWLVRRIAWRLQADDEGGLSERALAREPNISCCHHSGMPAWPPARICAENGRAGNWWSRSFLMASTTTGRCTGASARWPGPSPGRSGTGMSSSA